MKSQEKNLCNKQLGRPGIARCKKVWGTRAEVVGRGGRGLVLQTLFQGMGDVVPQVCVAVPVSKFVLQQYYTKVIEAT